MKLFNPLLRSVLANVVCCRYCFLPIGMAVFVLLSSCAIGACVCDLSVVHVGFDLLVGLGLVAIHLSLHEAIERFRRSQRIG